MSVRRSGDASAQEAEMRLNGPEQTNRNKGGASRTPEMQTSGLCASAGRGDVFSLSDSLSPRSKTFSKIRARFKKRSNILCSDCGRLLKRWMDVCGSLAAIVLLMPLFVFVAIWIKLDSPGPIFYRQIRVGLYGRPFYF